MYTGGPLQKPVFTAILKIILYYKKVFQIAQDALNMEITNLLAYERRS